MSYLDPDRFTAEVPGNFLCEICRGVVVKPAEHSTCETAFCGACIERWLETSPSCPHCREDTTSPSSGFRSLHRVLRLQLESLTLRCEHYPDCEEVLSLGGLDRHVETQCRFVRRTCEVPGCGFECHAAVDHAKHMEEHAGRHVELLMAALKKQESLNAVKFDCEAPVNSDGAPMKLGINNGGEAKLYCGRHLGRGAIPGSDGSCGPDNGPQCQACLGTKIFNARGHQVQRGREDKLYCGKRYVIPGSDGRCGPTNGPQCKYCEFLQGALPRNAVLSWPPSRRLVGNRQERLQEIGRALVPPVPPVPPPPGNFDILTQAGTTDSGQTSDHRLQFPRHGANRRELNHEALQEMWRTRMARPSRPLWNPGTTFEHENGIGNDSETRFDIGTFAEHQQSPGRELLSSCCAEEAPVAVAPSPEEVEALLSAVPAADPSADFTWMPGPVLPPEARAPLLELLDEAAAECSDPGELEDLKLTLREEELRALIGDAPVEELKAVPGFPSDFTSIRLRRCEAAGHCINFHLDHSLRTMQVALNDDSEYTGGALVFANRAGLHRPARPAGSATIHAAGILHGVTELVHGTRYGLFFLTEQQAAAR